MHKFEHQLNIKNVSKININTEKFAFWEVCFLGIGGLQTDANED